LVSTTPFIIGVYINAAGTCYNSTKLNGESSNGYWYVSATLILGQVLAKK